MATTCEPIRQSISAPRERLDGREAYSDEAEIQRRIAHTFSEGHFDACLRAGAAIVSGHGR